MRRQNSDALYRKWDRPLLAIIGAFVLGATLLPAAKDRTAEWRTYQKEFRQLVTAKYGIEKAAQVPAGVQQVWVPALQRADRCTTCHQGIRWAGFEKAPQPFRTHPRGPLIKHPIERFGCTPCHGGQGHAIDRSGAHGEIRDWDEPLLAGRLSKKYELTGVNRNALIQINCNACHRYDKDTVGAEAINLAKKTFKDQPCTDCHLVHGKGGTIGPDLTYIGDKQAEEFDFGRVRGPRTAFNWHVQHLENPPAVVPDTAMPNLDLTDEQAQSLAMLLLSWHKTNIPADYRPEVSRAMSGNGK